jgi:hypothetical protein
MKKLTLLFLLLAANASASGLDDLRTALASLSGDGSVRGTLQVRTEHSDNDGKGPGKSLARAAASVEDDAAGLRLAWDRSLMQCATEEKDASAGEEGEADALEAASATRIARSLHFAPHLLQMLKGATLKGERTTTVQGKPARELWLELPPVKLEHPEGVETAHALQVWIDADGMPTAAMQGWRIMLRLDGVVRSDMKMKRQFSFAHIGSRLVLLRDDEENRSEHSGLDRRYEAQRHDTFTFTPQP